MRLEERPTVAAIWSITPHGAPTTRFSTYSKSLVVTSWLMSCSNRSIRCMKCPRTFAQLTDYASSSVCRHGARWSKVEVRNATATACADACIHALHARPSLMLSAHPQGADLLNLPLRMSPVTANHSAMMPAQAATFWHSAAHWLPSREISTAAQMACMAATSTAAEDDTPLPSGTRDRTCMCTSETGKLRTLSATRSKEMLACRSSQLRGCGCHPTLPKSGMRLSALRTPTYDHALLQVDKPSRGSPGGEGPAGTPHPARAPRPHKPPACTPPTCTIPQRLCFHSSSIAPV